MWVTIGFLFASVLTSTAIATKGVFWAYALRNAYTSQIDLVAIIGKVIQFNIVQKFQCCNVPTVKELVMLLVCVMYVLF